MLLALPWPEPRAKLPWQPRPLGSASLGMPSGRESPFPGTGEARHLAAGCQEKGWETGDGSWSWPTARVTYGTAPRQDTAVYPGLNVILGVLIPPLGFLLELLSVGASVVQPQKSCWPFPAWNGACAQGDTLCWSSQKEPEEEQGPFLGHPNPALCWSCWWYWGKSPLHMPEGGRKAALKLGNIPLIRRIKE